MSYIKVTDTSIDLENKAKKFVVDGKEILLSKIGDSYYAIPDKCTHMGGSLSEGIFTDGVITCPRHGAKFDIKTGKSVGNAKLAFIKIKVGDTIIYPVKVEGTDILVDVD